MAERAHPEDPGFQEGSPYRANLFKRYAFANQYTAGKVIVDIPCGVGWGTSLLTAKERIGIDISADAIAYARAHYGDIDFRVGDMADIPLPNDSVDVVICLEGFEHVEKATGERFLDEAIRVTGPDGLLVMTVPIILPGGKHSGNPHHLHEPPLAELDDLLATRFHCESMDTVAGPDGPVVYFVGRPKVVVRPTERSGDCLRVDDRAGKRSRVLLTTSAAPAQSPFSTKEKRPPIGIGFLISVLRDAGHEVFFVDNYLQPSDFLETGCLQDNGIDFVGIYANTICFRDTRRMVHRLQRLREAHQWCGKIIVGGPHAAVAPQTIPDYVDHIVQGEGEQALRDIVEGRVTERIVRCPRIEDLDALPMPAWDCFVNQPYNWGVDFFEDRPVFTMNTSRGCPFKCTFCSVGSVWGKRYTCFSAERIVSDIEHVVHSYGAKGIYFREDNFTLDEKRLRRFCQLMIEKDIRIPWVCESRVSTLTAELVELMARAGARGFYFGVESGSQRMLDLFQKGITVEQIENAFRWCHEFKIQTAASMVVGVPGETGADLAATQELLARIRPTVTWPNVFVGIPDSRLYRDVLESRAYEYIDDRGLVYLPGHNERVRQYYGGGWNAGIPDTDETKDWTIAPKVSVLMAVHDGDRFVREALASIYSQTYPDFEVVIVDDGSTDKTPEILQEMRDSRTFIYRNAENQGLTKSLNIGMRLCRGKYVARMDADDVSHPRRLAKQVRFLDDNPECLVVGSWCNWIDAQGRVTGAWEPRAEANEIRERLRISNCVGHGSAMIRRAALEQAGGYNEAYPCAQDYELWLRLSEAGQVRNLKEYLYQLRDWDGAVSRRNAALQRRCADTVLLEACRRRREPYVTVVTVNHNTLDFTKLCIDKVFELADLPLEMLVVDNGSTDESLDYLRSERRIRLLPLSENIGHGPALDRAMEHVRSKYVVVMDSDAHPTRCGWLGALIEPLNDEVLVSGVHHHRDYVHPACLAMETQTFFDYGLRFKGNWPKDDDIKKLGVTHWDVGEFISMEVRRRGKRLHYFELSNAPSHHIVGSEYGGIVYHHFYGTRVVREPQRDAFGPVARRAVLEAKLRHFENVRAAAPADQGPVVHGLPCTGQFAEPPGVAERPKLSVVLTTYNRPELLKNVLQGFAGQTVPREDFEVVVVDDGSAPPVREVTDRFAGAVNLKYLHQENSGLAAARNAGICAAEGDILLFSDDDDIPSPELVAEHLRSHSEHPDESVAVLGHLDWHPDLDITPVMHYLTHVGGEYFGFDKLQDGQFYDQWKWWGGLVSAKRSLLAGVSGPFDARLRFGYEDTELMCRLLPRQIRVLYNARACSYVLRPVTFHEYCLRSYKQGRALQRVAATHPDLITPRYQLDDAVTEYKAKYAASLEQWAEKVARFECALAAQTPDVVTQRHMQALYTGYHGCFRGYLLKGYVEQLEAIGRGQVRVTDPVNENEPARRLPQAGPADLCPANRAPQAARHAPGTVPKNRPLRITFVNACTPGYDMGSSNLRIYHVLKILAAAGHAIDHLYLTTYPDDARYIAAFDGAVRFIKTAGTINGFEDYLHFNAVRQLDCVWITNLWMTNYMEYALELTHWLRRRLPDTRIIVDTMDFHSKKYLRRYELSRDEQDLAKANRFLELEKQLYPLADVVLAVTEVERRNILENVAASLNVQVIPNIHTVLDEEPAPSRRRHICFLGSFRVNHNVDAVRWFRDHVFPLVLARAPDIEFHILGHSNEEYKEAVKPHPNMKVIGYVQDAERAVAGYRLFVCPMTYGAGMKGKIGVAAGAATPVVTTTVGAEGFGLVDGENCFIEDDPRAFADKCLRLLRDDGLWCDFSTRAKRLVHENFGVEVVGHKIDDVLRGVISSIEQTAPVPTAATAISGHVQEPVRGGTGVPKVSIVTACRNCELFLAECLESIRGQTLPEWELLVLDDGSTDSTRRIIEDYSRRDSRIRPYYFDESKGPYTRRKFAITQANSPFIVIHDADDIMSAAKIETLHREITRDSCWAMVGSFYRTFLEQQRGLEYTECNDLPLEPDEIVEWFISWRHAMSHGSAIIRRALFDEIGPYDENPYASDSFWSAKLGEYIQRGAPWKVRNIPEYLTLIRVHATNQTQQLFTFDPRSRRTRYRLYCECKLRKIREKMQTSPGTDIGDELRHCDCSDFLVRFRVHIPKWENEPLHDDMIPQLLKNTVWLFNHACYISCVSMLSGIEVMECDLPMRIMNFDLLRAMALYALDLKERCLTYLHREIENHDSVAARAFLRDYFERSLRIDVQRWCAEHAEPLNLQVAGGRQVGPSLQRSNTTSG